MFIASDQPRPQAAFAIAGLALCALVLTGCYDAEALVVQARSTAISTRLVEVDLGHFETTMPRDPSTNTFTDVQVHIFGTVPRYRAASIRKQLGAEDFRLRHAVLSAVRTTTREELAEPELAQLRARLERVVNEVLDDSPVRSLGFYEVRLRHR